MAKHLSIIISCRGNHNTCMRVIPIDGMQPDDIQVKINNDVVYRGKNYKPLITEMRKRAKTQPKK